MSARFLRRKRRLQPRRGAARHAAAEILYGRLLEDRRTRVVEPIEPADRWSWEGTMPENQDFYLLKRR